jgi:nucleotide-binding universal stress UspA family protein
MNKKVSVSRILLPVDFSDRCRGAARYAESLASLFHAELTLLNVVTPPYVAWGEVSAYAPAADMYTQRWEDNKTQLDALLSDAPADLEVRRILLDGDPARQIVCYAQTEKYDWIVMPTHGYGPFRRFLLGSVTAKVLHDANCPVWTGPHLAEAPEWKSPGLHRIACALDLGPDSPAVLGWADAMAREFSADLMILHTLPASTVSLGGYTFDPDWRLQLERNARERIAALQEDSGARGEVHIAVGDVAPAVRDAVVEWNADLLVIGRTHGGLLGRLRANAYAIVRESPCPVVSI